MIKDDAKMAWLALLLLCSSTNRAIRLDSSIRVLIKIFFLLSLFGMMMMMQAPSNDATSIPTSLPPTGASTLATAARRPAGSGSTTRTVRRFKSTSSPVFVDQDERVNRSHSAWDLARSLLLFLYKYKSIFYSFQKFKIYFVLSYRWFWMDRSRPWSHFGEMSVSGSQPGLTETGSVTSIHTEVRESAASPTSSHSTLRKFRKSFSLRLSRRPSQDDTNNEVKWHTFTKQRQREKKYIHAFNYLFLGGTRCRFSWTDKPEVSFRPAGMAGKSGTQQQKGGRQQGRP